MSEYLKMVDGRIVPMTEDEIADFKNREALAASAPKPVPTSVSPRQIRQALTRAGLRQAVESAVIAGDQDLKDWWEFATAFERANQHVIDMGLALGVTEKQLDDLWILAGSL